MTLAIKQTKLTSFIHPFVFVFRETRVLNHSAPVQPLVFIICCEVPPNAACTCRLYDYNGNSYPAYCDLTSEPGTAWTLVMSWSVANRMLYPFRGLPFKCNAPLNENFLNWKVYRLNLVRTESLKTHSTHWRATCNYPTLGVDFRDYLRGNFKDFDIFDFVGAGTCKKVDYINIRGYRGFHLTAPFWQKHNAWNLHTDSSASTSCDFKAARTGAVSNEDNFGHYWYINSKFRCTQGPRSTTQWWFGAHL